MSDSARPGSGEHDRSADVADAYVASEIGARRPSGLASRIVLGTAIAWSLFQLWVASPLPYVFARTFRWASVLNSTEIRSIHLAFALFLAFTAYPALKRSPHDRVPWTDWLLAAGSAFSAAYIFLFYEQLSTRPGRPSDVDLIVAGVGMVTLLEATRRTLGPALMIIGMVFLAYVFFGQDAPGVLAWAGASFERAMSHLWLTTEGVFGVALGVSAAFVYLFVLFGALLEGAGAGNYFIKIAFALLGHLRGGPAKAAVIASGLTGLISGSSIANVVVGGSLTIPLMQRVGYPDHKAAAIEVASSVNGQIMPPVMGAAAFLMVEYVGIPYSEVIRHAAVPAIITYIALLYIVHLEAVKLGMRGLPNPASDRPWRIRLLRIGIGVTSLVLVVIAIHYAVVLTQVLFGDLSFPVVLAGFLALYLGLLWVASRQPDLAADVPDVEPDRPPELIPTLLTGLHFLLPIYVLVWCLMVERLSPGLSAYWATIAIIFIILTQQPLIALFRGARDLSGPVKRGFSEFVEGLITGARNMVGIGVATAAAGIVVGSVTLTGVGQVLSQFVEFLSGGNILLMLILVAVICLILGMGLPTTANYIVVATLMAPVVVDVGAQNGLVVPLIAVHMFVFYFGLMADVTPPVGLASFAAAAISRADPIKTGIQSFFYEIRTAVLPFMFIFNTKLLLIGLEGPLDTVLTIGGAVVAMLLFSAATQRWFLTRSRLWESAVLLLVAFTLLRPGFWLDMFEPPFDTVSFAEARERIPDQPAGANLRLVVRGITLEGDEEIRTVLLPLGPPGTTEERLRNAGLVVGPDDDGGVVVEQVVFGSPAETYGIGYGYEVLSIEVPNQRFSRYWFFVPALLALAGIVFLQRRRVERMPVDANLATEARPVRAGER